MSDDHLKARLDAVLYGTGYMKDGKHVSHEDVYLDPRDAIISAWLRKNGYRQLSDAINRGEHLK